MKKIKLLAPTLVLASLTTAAPVAMLTSCSKNETNKVYLAKGQTAEKTVSPTTNVVTYKFKQTNLVNPESLKVNVANLYVNGVKVSNRSKTFMYNKDSAGNVTVRVYTSNVLASWSNVSTFSFDLLFTNKKAGTKHLVGPFTINFDTGSEANIDTSDSTGVTFTSLNGNPVVGQEVVYKITPEDGQFLPTSISVKDKDGVELDNGVKYAYDRYSDGDNPNVACLYIPCATPDMKITVKSITASADPYPYASHIRLESESYKWTGSSLLESPWYKFQTPIGSCFIVNVHWDDKPKTIAQPTIYDVAAGQAATGFNWNQMSTDWYVDVNNELSPGKTYIISWTDSYSNNVQFTQSFVVQTTNEGGADTTADDAEETQPDEEEEMPVEQPDTPVVE